MNPHVRVLIQVLVGARLALASVCPPEDLVKPCDCWLSDFPYENESGMYWMTSAALQCGGDEPIDLRLALHNITEQLQENVTELTFDRFEIRNNQITEIKKNTTHLLTFYGIEIHAPQLERIHSEAFNGTNDYVEMLDLGNQLVNYKNQAPPYYFFDLVNSMDNIAALIVNAPQFDLIPSMAFKKLPKLIRVEFELNLDPKNTSEEDERKLTVQNSAFYNLQNLEDLTLKSGRIDQIPSDMFKFRKPSKDIRVHPLNVDLTQNLLTSSSFEKNSLSNFKKQTTLDISENQIEFLDEKIFKPFLELDENNKIRARGEQIDCSHKRNRWWMKDEKYRQRVEEGNCEEEEENKKKDKDKDKDKDKEKSKNKDKDKSKDKNSEEDKKEQNKIKKKEPEKSKNKNKSKNKDKEDRGKEDGKGSEDENRQRQDAEKEDEADSKEASDETTTTEGNALLESRKRVPIHKMRRLY